MLRHSFRGLAVAAVAASILGPSPAAAVTPVSACRDLDKLGETYVLTGDITTIPDTGPCLHVLADRITIDLAGHSLKGQGFQDTQGISGSSVTLTVVKNGTIQRFEFGIDLETSSRTTIRNVTVSANQNGLRGGAGALVKDSTANNNIDRGMVIGDGGQVEGALIEGQGEGGLFGGDRILVTRSIVRNNSSQSISVGAGSTITNNTLQRNELGIIAGPRSLVTGNTVNIVDTDGIRVGERSVVRYNTVDFAGEEGIDAGPGSTVSNNTVRNSNRDGILVGQGSTVSYNTVSDSDEDGIEAVCPSTITHNEVGPSGEENIHTIGDGCFVKFNLLNVVGNADPQ